MAKRRFTDDTNGGRKRASNGGTRERYSFAEMRFVRIELTEQEKQEFKQLLAANEFEPGFLDTCVKAHYNITFSQDKQGNGVLCSIRAEFKEMLDGGLILTGRGSSALTALAVCEYKSNYLADEDGWAAAEIRRGGSYDDIG